MKIGRVTPKATGQPVEVDYELWFTGPDDAVGRIRIDDDPSPGDRFMGNHALVFSGDLTCILETSLGKRVHIFFTDSNGSFECRDANEAKDAL